MPNSLKSKLKKLVYQGHLTEKDLSRLYTDNDVVAELEKIKAELEKLSDDEWNQSVGASKGLDCAIDIIDDYISELKGEQEC